MSASRFVLALALSGAALAFTPALRAQSDPPRAVDFAKEVLPILEARCFSCHQAPKADARGRVQKPKGGLRLDGAHWLRKGGDTGRVVVANQPEKSELLRRVELPEDDPDLMPPKDGALSAEQIATLRAWIAGGAEIGAWVGAPAPAGASDAPAPSARPANAVNARQLALRELGEGLSPLPEATLAKLRSEKLRLEPALPGSALLRASFPAHRSEITDADVLALAPLSEHLAIVDLARTKLGAKSVAFLAGLPRLAKLDLSDTGLATRDLEACSTGLRATRELNLNGNNVDDAALVWLAGLPVLEDLYLWRTKVTEAGIAKLRAAKPSLHLRHQLELPEPPTDTPPDRQRRRR
ncbi:MAG: hypothetical protein IPN34_23105 [Planctomycetes bacterium]|nr:hypothetical protein [Planctomycetota bacterium]